MSTEKIRITTLLDKDIVNELKRQAERTPGAKYQTLLNHILRKAVLGRRDKS